MQHVRFGRTGLRVSRLCLGTMTFGLQCDEKTSHAILDAAAAHSITFLAPRTCIRLVSVQPRYNLLFRQIERELLPLCWEEGLAVIPYNPLAGGLPTGKHKRDAPLQGSRFTLGTAGKMYVQRYWKESELDTVNAFVQLAVDNGLEPATLAVAWVLAHPAITAPLVGASKPEQLTASVAAVELQLDLKLKARLDDLTQDYRMGDAARCARVPCIHSIVFTELRKPIPQLRWHAGNTPPYHLRPRRPIFQDPRFTHSWL